jgi:hypothetical protein
MNKNKTLILITLSLVLSIFIFTTCKRDAIEEPSPIGPSSFAVLLYLNASPNVIFAGFTSRQMATITATLKKYDGTPFAGKTLYFEVVDSAGDRIENIGYFEGNTSLQSKNTDGSGIVTLNYYGPLSDEITANGTIYIKATAAWEGSQFIYETAPLYIIRDADEVALTAEAVPDVLYSGLSKPTAEIRAMVRMGGAPVKDYPVYFGIQQNLGRFDDGSKNAQRLTNQGGVASITYVGPGYWEIPSAGTTVTIRVQITQSIYKDVSLKIYRFE